MLQSNLDFAILAVGHQQDGAPFLESREKNSRKIKIDTFDKNHQAVTCPWNLPFTPSPPTQELPFFRKTSSTQCR